jgi:hypothetical protein
MSTEGLPAALVAFLSQYIHSVRQLETVLFLRAHPDDFFTVEAVTTALRSNQGTTKKWLEEFVSGRILSKQNSPLVAYRFQPADPKIAEVLTELAKEYKVRPLKVIDVVVNRSTDQMMSFMHAFQIGKEGNEDG